MSVTGPAALRRTERLAAGDPCEFRWSAQSEWQTGTVLHNGGSAYWRVQPDHGERVAVLYIEHVRAPGTDPWDEPHHEPETTP